MAPLSGTIAAILLVAAGGGAAHGGPGVPAGTAGSAAFIPADPIARWQPYVAEAAARFGLPPATIMRVIAAESGGMTHLHGRPITSRAGAMGLMQLMPATWAQMRARLALGPDPHDPHDNILAGSLYLRLMIDRFGTPGAFAAYNAGPGRYADHLASGRRLPRETVAYLAKVVDVVMPTQGARADSLFAVIGPAAGEAGIRPADPLFAIRRAGAADGE